MLDNLGAYSTFEGDMVKLEGLDSKNPLMQIGEEVWEGTPSLSLGSIMLFNEKAEYLASTSHVIKMRKLKLSKKE